MDYRFLYIWPFSNKIP